MYSIYFFLVLITNLKFFELIPSLRVVSLKRSRGFFLTNLFINGLLSNKNKIRFSWLFFLNSSLCLEFFIHWYFDMKQHKLSLLRNQKSLNLRKEKKKCYFLLKFFVDLRYWGYVNELLNLDLWKILWNNLYKLIRMWVRSLLGENLNSYILFPTFYLTWGIRIIKFFSRGRKLNQ